MFIKGDAVRVLRRILPRDHFSRNQLRKIDRWIERRRHLLAEDFPAVIKPQPRLLTVAITAQCNLRCIGCRYGRDFMAGSQLPYAIVRDLLNDARAAGFQVVRLYGGEPLLHRELPNMVRHAADIGLVPVITTNAILLGGKIDELYDAGLRAMTVGYYGYGLDYDKYVQRASSYVKFEESVARVRDKYGMRVQLQINYLLTRLSCDIESLHEALRFAKIYQTRLQVDIAHYSLPYFTEGVDRELQFQEGDHGLLQKVVDELYTFKDRHPELYPESIESIRSIPDWAVKGPNMKVPCTAYRMLWIGADGSVQLCYVTFPLGNLYQNRLRDFIFSAEHKQACKDAFALNCPNCHCERDDRIQAHAASRQLYRIS